ncbi:FAD-binding oxidoreductase [Streptomyces liangshanensis]|uniref:FAD-binding oxidoreductase n=1 Tax=Streptomyces liangshanensis TaxID=2717324 RepID=UPI0036DDBB18
MYDSSVTALTQDLVRRLGSETVTTAGPAFEATRRIWNAAVDSRPAVVVHARGARDVRAAVTAAREHGVPLAVRGGGHDWAGRGLRHGGLVIDLTRMRQVTVDTTLETATLGGGATAADVVDACAPAGLVPVTGTVGTVGMAGLTLGGGYGLLGGRFGMAADNLLGAEMVLADGRLVTVDAEHEPELFWAIRGGGGNFGVVTSLRVRLHAVGRVLAGMVGYGGQEAASVLSGLREIQAEAPDELTVQAVFLTGPDGDPALFLVPAWCGATAAGEAAVARLSRLGTPFMSQVGPMPYSDLLHLNDAQGEVTGRHYAARTRTLTALTPEVIDTLVHASRTKTTPMSGIPVHHFHGAAARVPVDATAFPTRRDHVMAEIVAVWEPDDAPAPHRAWADATAEALAGEALPGGYVNMLGPLAHDQIAYAYGPNTDRLLAAKAHFDPDAVFSATPLPAPPGA